MHRVRKDFWGATIASLWAEIWFRPRATIRRAVDSGALRGAVLLSMASGVVQALVAGANNHVGFRGSALVILAIALPIGVGWGMLQLAILTALLYVVGRWTNSPGTLPELCTALGWASVPISAALPLWVIATVFIGRALYIDPQDVAWSQPWHLLLTIFVALATAVCIAWWWVILAKAVAEVRRISTWAAVGHLVLALVLVGLVGLFLAVATAFVTNLLHGSHPPAAV